MCHMQRLCVISLIAVLLLSTGYGAVGAVPRAYAEDGPLPLSAYPRPPQDNGLGIHWSTNVYGQSKEIVDYFVAEMEAMGIKWVKFLNDGTEGRHNEYLIQQLVAHGMMPIMRIYDKCNRPLDLGSLRRLVQHYRPMGVYYYELYNEPELDGIAGGWCHGEKPDPERMADMWVPAARVVQEEGGFPSLPSMFPPSLKDPDWQDSFFIRFLRRIKETGNTSVLYRSWGAVHNYFLNHPLRYPYDEVNLYSRPLTQEEIVRYGLSEAEVQAINHAREISRLPRSQGGYFVGTTIDEDNSCFLQFIAYHDRFYEMFGFEIPLLSTEGGVTVGSSEDPRYPKVTPELQAERTIEAFEYMLDEAPPYYFVFTSWLLAERAMDNFNPTWESWAWYKDRSGNHLPVVDALKRHPRRGEERRHAPKPDSTQRNPLIPTPASTGSPREVTPSLMSVPTPETPQRDRPWLTLAEYPRPARDNGWGIHWTPTLFSQSPETVDRLLEEVQRLGLRWVKIMQPDEPKLQHRYLLQRLQDLGIMPILRIYRPYNTPYEHLDTIVQEGVAQRVYYYELYNEPNIEGFPGGWQPGEPISVSRIVDLWIPAARQIAAMGGYPGLPALAPGGSYDDMRFLAEFLDLLKERDALDTLDRAWVPLHNYFLNHPLDYPQDPVNLYSVPLSDEEARARGLTPQQVQAINHARRISRLPREQGGYYVGDTIDEDSNGFRKFEAYRNIIYAKIGRELPIISTEGGAIAGSREDPRYPPLTDQDVAEMTRGAFAYMIEQAPPYYFAFMPWLLSNLDAGGGDPSWENAAWLPAHGDPRPVVQAIRQLAAQQRTRRYLPVAIETASKQSAASAPPKAVPLDGAREESSALPVVTTTELWLPTYDYKNALVPTSPGDPIYPFPRLDFARVGPATPRRYEALTVETSTMRLTIIPELGGRVYQWLDKSTGRSVLYSNSVVKPAPWGARGWWLGVGGIEWSFPVDEHGFHEFQPWNYSVARDGSSVRITLSRVDEKTGLRADVQLTVRADSPILEIQPKISNPTSRPQPFQFWINGMLAPGGRTVSPETVLVWPDDRFVVHSSSDEAAYPSRSIMLWPSGRAADLRLYRSWPSYLGIFGDGDAARDMMGVYDPRKGVGVVRWFPGHVTRGVKFFAGPGLDPSIWTDDGSRYLEMWGGWTPDFWTHEQLAPGESISWTERWFVTGRIGPVIRADGDMAVGLGAETGRIVFGVTALNGLDGWLVLLRDGEEQSRWAARLTPGESLGAWWPSEHPKAHVWQLEWHDASGQVRMLARQAGGDLAPVGEEAASVEPAPRDLSSQVGGQLSGGGEALRWDPRLDDLGVRLERSEATGQRVWRLTEALWEDPREARGLHHVFVRVLDEAGRPVDGVEVILKWPDGSSSTRTHSGEANFPLYGPLGEYTVSLEGNSDRVVGLGLPRKHHVNYRLTFQRRR